MGTSESTPNANPTSQQPSGPWYDYLQSIKSSSPSEIIPYYKSQITYLEKLFRRIDKKNTKSIQLGQLAGVEFVSRHPLAERIMQLFEEELVRVKTKKINFEIFLHLLTPFHINTTKQDKCKFIFRLFDWDKDLKLGINDLYLTFDLMFRQKIVYEKTIDQQTVKNMAGEALARYGVRGEIKLQEFVQMMEQDEVKQFLTFRFVNE